MTSREIRLSDLIGRNVRDVDGSAIGRIEEMHAEIELHEHGNDYVVVEFHVGAYGALAAMAGGRFARQVMRTMGRLVRYRSHRVPWEVMDLTDPANPRVLCRASELPTD